MPSFSAIFWCKCLIWQNYFHGREILYISYSLTTVCSSFLCFQIIYFQKIVIHFYHHHLAGLHALVKSKVVISIFGKKLRYSSMAAISSLSNSGIVKSFFLIYFTTSATNAMTTLSLWIKAMLRILKF